MVPQVLRCPIEGRGDGGKNAAPTTAVAVGMVTATAIIVARKKGWDLRRARKSVTARSCKGRVLVMLSLRYLKFSRR